MKRVEIITNQSIAEDILEALEDAGIGTDYTLLPHIHGRGKKGTRLGSALWPEENCVYIVYLEDRHILKLKETIGIIKKKFPNEGTKCFVSPVEDLL